MPGTDTIETLDPGALDPGALREDPGALRARGDHHRDLREWEAAAKAYAAYLELAPEDWPLHVQLGHCVKEAGDVAGALAQYRRAEEGMAEDADLQLQIGHALKMLGRLAEAEQAYARTVALDPASDSAWGELIALRRRIEEEGAPPVPPVAEPAPAPVADAPAAEEAPAPPPAASVQAPPAPAGFPRTGLAVGLAVFFDVSDLMAWFGAHRAPSGIQRVQLEIVAEALRRAGGGAVPQVVVFRASLGAWRALPQELFLRLWLLSQTGTDIREPAWVDALAQAEETLRRGPDIDFPEGAWLVNPGTSWWQPDYFRHLREAKARSGIGFAPLLHDCVPLVVPEHCEATLVAQYARWFSGLALHADLMLVTSSSTRDDLMSLHRQLLPGLRVPPVALMPLDVAMRRAPATTGAPPARLPGLERGQPYVLFVSTIESRKNHLMVFNAWLSLVRRHGMAAVPKLVCVGRPGWLAQGAMALLQNSPVLQEKVVLRHDVSDSVLQALYERCLFTLYNSHHEGWGLPVTESLSFGKVPLVSAVASLPEAGGAGAVLFQPRSEPDLVEKLEKLILDRDFLRAQEEKLAREVRLRSWPEVTAQLLGFLSAVPAPAREVERPRLELGRGYALARLPGSAPQLEMAVADMVRLGGFWHAPEEWGCWTRPGPARLSLPLAVHDAGPETRLRIYLELAAPPAAQRLSIILPGAVEPVALNLAAGRPATCVLEAPLGDGTLEIELDAAEALEAPGAEGPVGVGVTSVMVCRHDDLMSRLDYLERRRFLWPTPV
jgi:glycosyltransferase involved in cell wall biosynthesis